MIVKIKKDCQTLLGNHQTGDEVDLPEAIAQKLLDRGLVVLLLFFMVLGGLLRSVG